jgi:hypothetical protein
MALTSPGVQVSVIDESFYTPAEPGTRPLVIVASAENKRNASGTGVAQGTLKFNAGKVFTVTSQRELADLFGDPTFRVDNNNNPIHGGELNEYGLQAAYSFLGVANSALVVRADIDLNQLNPQAAAPGGEPQDGTFWLDTSTTSWGIFEWNAAPASVRGGQAFAVKNPLIVLEASDLTTDGPKPSVGKVGDYAVAVGVDSIGTTVDDRDTHIVTFYYKNRNNAWAVIGSSDWTASHPVIVSKSVASGLPSLGVDGEGDPIDYTLNINGDPVPLQGITTMPAVAAAITDAEIDEITASYNASTGVLEIFSTGASVALTGTLLGLDLGVTAGRTYFPPKLTIAKHTQVPAYKSRDSEPRPTGSVWIKTTEPNQGARWRLKKYNGATKLWENVEAPIFPTSEAALAELDRTGGGINLPLNAAYVQSNFSESSDPLAQFRVLRRSRTGPTVIRTTEIVDNVNRNATWTFQMSESLAGFPLITTLGDKIPGRSITVTLNGTAADSETLAGAINAAAFVNVVASVDSNNRVVVTHTAGGEIRFADQLDGVAFVGGILQFDRNSNVYQTADEDNFHEFVGSNWIPLTITPDTATAIRQSYYISNNNPQTLVEDGQLWYSSVVDEVDIMIHNGTTWVGYRNFDHDGPGSAGDTDRFGPVVSASQPTSRPDGGDAFVEGDLWIDTSDLDNYPVIKRYDDVNKRWVTLDISDQTTENGVLFADARWSTAGDKSEPATIEQLLTNNFLDFDAPDPALYPRGMLLWNLRRSGFNVKKFKKNYIDPQGDNIRFNNSESMENYYPHRWVTESANQADGSGSFGRKAQRKVVQIALQALVNSNQEIRDTERNGFNLLACPGYPELIGEMISLNYDRGLTSFVIGDTPVRLTPDATTLNNWGTNLRLALEDNEQGLVSFDEYLGVFYPWGFTSDNAGRDVVVPPSHMIMRMIALSDNVSYPWFAPAGTRRGGITNATAVGYLNKEGEFVSVALNEGQRDTLYNIKVNPITFFVGSGLVNYGQKTRARNASALDRINVARLVIYLRSQLNKLAKPYIFEPNDKITRDEIKQQVESLLLELVGQRALYDFLVVCDESNNTPNRIDRNELYVDIAIEPVKAVEFIYIPVRLKNTGEIAGL